MTQTLSLEAIDSCLKMPAKDKLCTSMLVDRETKAFLIKEQGRYNSNLNNASQRLNEARMNISSFDERIKARTVEYQNTQSKVGLAKKKLNEVSSEVDIKQKQYNDAYNAAISANDAYYVQDNKVKSIASNLKTAQSAIESAKKKLAEASSKEAEKHQNYDNADAAAKKASEDYNKQEKQTKNIESDLRSTHKTYKDEGYEKKDSCTKNVPDTNDIGFRTCWVNHNSPEDDCFPPHKKVVDQKCLDRKTELETKIREYENDLSRAQTYLDSKSSAKTKQESLRTQFNSEWLEAINSKNVAKTNYEKLPKTEEQERDLVNAKNDLLAKHNDQTRKAQTEQQINSELQSAKQVKVTVETDLNKIQSQSDQLYKTLETLKVEKNHIDFGHYQQMESSAQQECGKIQDMLDLLSTKVREIKQDIEHIDDESPIINVAVSSEYEARL
jgi:DNA repair exonuclease SbcCD ATPase subunit